MDVLPIIIFAISLPVALLIAVPLGGVVVRFRANYNPKGLQLDGEGGVLPHTGPQVTSLYGMFRRVLRYEGWAGLYKGFMPTLVVGVVVALLVGLILPGGSFTDARQSKYAAPTVGVLGTILYSIIMMILSLPFLIITNRSITTPHKLPWLNALYSLRVLLTPAERRRPWLLFMTPGLIVSQSLSIIFVTLALNPLRRLLFPSMVKWDGAPDFSKDFTVLRLSLYFIIVLVSTAVMNPLEVISTRLSIQRNHGPSGYDLADQHDELPGADLEYAAVEEDVIGLRPEDDPYTGFFDALKRIVGEEGYSTLYRAWWLVFMGIFFGGSF